ncbi:MAG: hypothetical protein ACI9HK_003415, partial [Pirellulaceae bacterium]
FPLNRCACGSHNAIHTSASCSVSLLGIVHRSGVPNSDAACCGPHGPNNHSVRSQEYRYIRYADGGEELYDDRKDPGEFQNLASAVDMTEVKTELAEWLQQQNVPETPRDKNVKKKPVTTAGHTYHLS